MDRAFILGEEKRALRGGRLSKDLAGWSGPWKDQDWVTGEKRFEEEACDPLEQTRGARVSTVAPP